MENVRKFQAEQGAFNLDEAAKFIGVSHVTMASIVKQRDFPALRVGRRWVIPRDALIKWMNGKAEERLEL